MRIVNLAATATLLLVVGRAAADCGPYVPQPPAQPQQPSPPQGNNPANEDKPSEPPSNGGGPDGGPSTPGGGTGGPSTPSGGGGGPDAGPSTPGGGGGGPSTDGGGGGPSTGDGGGRPSGGDGPAGSGGGPVTGSDPRGRHADTSRDRGNWSYWWSLNRASIVDLAPKGPAVALTPGENDKAATELWREEAHAALAKALNDTDSTIVRDVVLALGKTRDPLDALLFGAIVGDKSRPISVRESAAMALGLLPATDEMSKAASRRVLEKSVRDPSTPTELRASCLYALGMRRDAASVPLLAEFATGGSETWDVPAAALTALGLSGCTLAREDLERQLAAPKDPRTAEPMRRVYAAHGLALLHDAQSLPALRTAAGDNVIEVRRAAVLALGAVAPAGDAETVKTLSGVLTRDKDRIVRGMAAISLGRVGGEAAATALRHAQAENEASMRSYVALGLGLVARNSKDDAIAKSLIRDLTANQQSDVAGALCIAVGLSGHADGVPVLRTIVKDAKDPDVRGHAAVALGLVHDTNEGSTAVRSLLELQVPHVQSEGAIGLGLMASRESVAALGDTLDHGTVPGTQAAAALALGRIGGADAARRLTAVVSDPSRPLVVRRMAINGLGIALDRQGGRPTSMVGASLDWCALTMSVVDVVSIQ